MIEKLIKKVSETSEIDFLKYLIDCCENILENPNIIVGHEFEPMAMQLFKLRAEVSQRLEAKFNCKHGKFATRTHLFARK